MPPVETVRQDGPKIRELRIRAGVSLTDLGKQIHRHPKALGHLERETRRASRVMISQLANAFGVQPDELIRDDDEEPAAA